MFPLREKNIVNSNGTTKNRLGLDDDVCEVSSTNHLQEDECPADEYPDIDDLDLSLLCPDIILELKDDPIVINNVNPVQYTKIHCTACNDHLGSALSSRNNRFVHPLLKVMVCGECYEFYSSGEFEKEEDGSEKHCRWCGQGGKVLCCSKCQFVFCMSCIRINLGRSKLEKIKRDENWTCFNCDPSQIAELRAHCTEVMEYTIRETSRVGLLANASELMNVDYSQCCSKTESISDDKKKLRPKSLVVRTIDPPKGKNGSKSLSASSMKTKPKLKGNNIASVPKNPIRILPKPVLAPISIASSNFYGDSANHRYIQAPSHDQRMIIINNDSNTKTVHTSKTTYTVTTPSTIQDNFNNQKLFYQNAMRSAYKINSDLFCDLAMVRNKKPKVTDLEEQTSMHNTLQDLLNKSVRSLMQLQGELEKCKLDQSELKLSNNSGMKKSFGSNRI